MENGSVKSPLEEAVKYGVRMYRALTPWKLQQHQKHQQPWNEEEYLIAAAAAESRAESRSQVEYLSGKRCFYPSLCFLCALTGGAAVEQMPSLHDLR